MPNKKKKSSPVKKNKKEVLGLRVVDVDQGAFEAFADSVSAPWRVFYLGFLRGAGFGLGALIGGAIIFTIISYIFSALYNVPFIGEILRGFADNVTSNMR